MQYLLEHGPGRSVIQKFTQDNKQSIEMETELCMKALKKMGPKTSLHHGPAHSNSETHKKNPEDISIMQWLLRYSFNNEKP